jgi:hypothetical protein
LRFDLTRPRARVVRVRITALLVTCEVLAGACGESREPGTRPGGVEAEAEVLGARFFWCHVRRRSFVTALTDSDQET